MVKSVDLLSPPSNYAVVQLPDRRFPGVVVQGDSLHELVRDLDVMLELLDAGRLVDLQAEIECMQQQLAQVLFDYEQVCADRGIQLPYARPYGVPPQTDE